ncbi:DEKNAAC100371 [Brettanomyces naardenensis]|uniref:Anthranilate phosphoribosyltransferase n=1 Tax=Brettanomyces naardenensis TaxID=13370 RepID=A0A448YGE9_BRENA|nr:DEKNAAC100371 [Brettanomyces naardenensis]
MGKVLTPYIKALLTEPPILSLEEFSKALGLIFDGEANDIETSSFLTALQLRKLHFNAEFLATAVETILQYSEKIPATSVDKDGYIDIVGTGGDSKNTFNVSTSAAIVGAGMGLKVCKHGGNASTSTSGAGDLMSELGVQLMKINAETAPTVIGDSDLCFLFAPAFHHGMARVINVRKNLGIPTIFNILGPLLNPIPLKARILGVYTEDLGKVYCEAAVKLDKKRGRKPANTMVVWGEIGLDELSPVGKSKVWKYNDKTDSVDEFTLSPKDFGLPEHSLDLVRSGTPAENAVTLRNILGNNVETEPGKNPLVDYVLLNAAALAVVGGLTVDWKEGVKIAYKSISSGAALDALEKFIESVDQL